jgi:hypothetical protein
MSTGKGVEARCALGVESTFGTAVAVTEIIPFSSESISRAIQQFESQYMDGNVGRRNLKNSVVSVLGGLECELVWDDDTGDPIGLERILRGFLGASARDSGDTLNQYKTANAVDDHYTICFNKQVSNWEVVSAKFNTLTLNGEAGGKIMLSTDIIGYDLLRTGDAGITNAIAAVTALSNTDQPENLAFDDMIFRIGDQTNALASGDQYKIDSFELVSNNNLMEPQFSSVDSVHTDSLKTLEPERNGQREINLAVTLPRYDSDQFFTWLNSATGLQADLKFTSGSYEFNILLPNIRIIGDPQAQISGVELIKPEINIMALRLAAKHAYMKFQDDDLIADEIGIEAKSGRSSAA